MEVRIIKGTNQIGGCITEITSSKGTRIIIDFGEDLVEDNQKVKKQNPNIDGLTIGTKKYDAVFITHSHSDHIGLINYILDDIPVYVEPMSKIVYKLLGVFTYQGIRFKTNDMKFNESIIINDMVITPYFVDHSAYNSCMLLVECDGKRMLHTGDFRSNGLKGNEFDKTLKELGSVDIIVTEGTTLSREDIDNETEEHLMKRAKEVFNKYNQVFILQSSTNIDRIKVFYDAATETGKTFIEDIFTSNLTLNLKDKSIPNPLNRDNVYTWITSKYGKDKSQKFKQKYVNKFKERSKQKSYKDKKYCLMVKSSMLEAIIKLYNKNMIDNACLIYSMWDGYKEKEETKIFLEEIKKYGIHDIIDLHTSGHADRKTIKLLNKLQAKKVIPIHTTEPEKLKEILDNVVLVKENKIVEV